MKILIITVAGSSTRFSRSIGYETIKCLYNENGIEESLLYKMLHHPIDFDKYIIVVGYKYEKLKNIIYGCFNDMKDKITLVFNPYYLEYGSGYSLYCGLQEALRMNASTITFAEGDLFIDSDSFFKVYKSEKSVITYNKDAILANKAVVLYFDLSQKARYVYDAGHSALEIKEPFVSIYNSGQIWKFSDLNAVRNIISDMDINTWVGTNLVFIEKYFRHIDASQIELVMLEKWINCNTVEDFKQIEAEK